MNATPVSLVCQACHAELRAGVACASCGRPYHRTCLAQLAHCPECQSAKPPVPVRVGTASPPRAELAAGLVLGATLAALVARLAVPLAAPAPSASPTLTAASASALATSAASPAYPAWNGPASHGAGTWVPREPPLRIALAGTATAATGVAGRYPTPPLVDALARETGLGSRVEPKVTRFPGWVALDEPLEVSPRAFLDVALPPGRYAGFYAKVQSAGPVTDAMQALKLRVEIRVGGGGKEAEAWRQLPLVPLTTDTVRFHSAAGFDRARLSLVGSRAVVTLAGAAFLEAPGAVPALDDAARYLTVRGFERGLVALETADGVAFELPFEMLSGGRVPGGTSLSAPSRSYTVAHGDNAGRVEILSHGQDRSFDGPVEMARAVRSTFPADADWLSGSAAWTLLWRPHAPPLSDRVADPALAAYAELREDGSIRLVTRAGFGAGDVFGDCEQLRHVIRHLLRPGTLEPGAPCPAACASLRARVTAAGSDGDNLVRFLCRDVLDRFQDHVLPLTPPDAGSHLELVHAGGSAPRANKVVLTVTRIDGTTAELSGGGRTVKVPLRVLHSGDSVIPGAQLCVYREP